MSRGKTGLAVALVAAAVGGAGAAHASSREVMVPSLPEGYPMVVAPPEGGAWLLGDEEPGYFGPRTMLGGFGSWGVGQLEGGARRPGVGLAGALGGAFVGDLLIIPLANLGRSESDPVRAAIVGIAAGLVGCLATFGYQLGGGGPRPADTGDVGRVEAAIG